MCIFLRFQAIFCVFSTISALFLNSTHTPEYQHCYQSYQVIISVYMCVPQLSLHLSFNHSMIKMHILNLRNKVHKSLCTVSRTLYLWCHAIVHDVCGLNSQHTPICFTIIEFFFFSIFLNFANGITKYGHQFHNLGLSSTHAC